MNEIIPYGRQLVDEDDIDAVIEVLQSKMLTQGPKTAEFELDLCNVVGSKFGIAVNSGTSALHIACLAAGVKENDEVITSPITFVASANCIVYCGGKPIFADINPETYNISPDEIERLISKKTKAIIPVHFAGQSCDMERINQIVKNAEKKYGNRIYIIEDACHALGSKYLGSEVGSCEYSDMTVLSFHPVKHITTGEGGVVFTNKTEISNMLMKYRSHGITSTPEEIVYKKEGFNTSIEYDKPMMNQWYYEQKILGYNYRITNIQAALGCSQLKKLSSFILRRREIVNIYNKAFQGIKNITVPFESENCKSNFHLYVLLFNFKNIGIDRASLMKKLKSRNIETQVHYIPVHTQPFYQNNYKTKWRDYPNAENYYRQCLSIPLFPAMTNEEIEKTIYEVKKAVI
ncbi:MAG: UDP-4-amino-4,6-dideoxy-N-acetyl-beta-L-altrosamine transaminase [Desulfobacterales bacterium]|nr:UDP-4-amino-4,6-dideoxy-N-acetyl-beta-L-altrosamine transaminase [Desulfobacterales bacterium]